MKQLARVEHHLATLEDKFRSQDHRFIAIEAANQEILFKLNNLTPALESLASVDQSLSQQSNQNSHPISRSNTTSTSSSISSSPSVSPVEPLLGQSHQHHHHQQQHQDSHPHPTQNNTNNNNNHHHHQHHHHHHQQQQQHQQQNQQQQHHQEDNLAGGNSQASNSNANPLSSLYINPNSAASVGFGAHAGTPLQQQPNVAALAASQFLAALNQLGDLEPRLLASTLGAAAAANVSVVDVATNLTKQQSAAQSANAASQSTGGPQSNNTTGSTNLPVVHSIPHPHSHHAHPAASLLVNSPHYQTVRTKYSTRRYSRRRVGPEEAMADPAIRATVNLKMPVVPKTILIVLKHRLTVQTAITLACAQTGERLRKGAIQKKLEAMFREPGAVDAFLAEWDHSR